MAFCPDYLWQSAFLLGKEMTFLSRVQKAFTPTPNVERKASYDDRGFNVTLDGKAIASVRWADVVEITTFKQDIFSYDRICFGFRRASDTDFAWISEEDVPFGPFTTFVATKFPSLKSDWYQTVVQPAFVENWMTIWKKEPNQLPEPTAPSGRGLS